MTTGWTRPRPTTAPASASTCLDLLPIGGTALKGEFIAGKTGIGTPSDAGAGLGLAGHAWYATVVQNVTDSVQVAARYEQFVKDNNLKAPAVKKTDQWVAQAQAKF